MLAVWCNLIFKMSKSKSMVGHEILFLTKSLGHHFWRQLSFIKYNPTKWLQVWFVSIFNHLFYFIFSLVFFELKNIDAENYTNINWTWTLDIIWYCKTTECFPSLCTYIFLANSLFILQLQRSKFTDISFLLHNSCSVSFYLATPTFVF